MDSEGEEQSSVSIKHCQKCHDIILRGNHKNMMHYSKKYFRG